MSARRRVTVLICGVSAAALLAGCRNPDAPTGAPVAQTRAVAGTAGEPGVAAPPAAARESPRDVLRTPQLALVAFADLYINWSYRSLGQHQMLLAAMSVGAARLAESQAAAVSGGDGTIARAHLRNSGTVVSVAPERGDAGRWVLVTRERTGGDGEYEGLASSFHVTLARVVAVPGGYAVSEWLPQN